MYCTALHGKVTLPPYVGHDTQEILVNLTCVMSCT